jgi:hypothetical protein
LIWSGFVENVEVLTQMLSDLGARCIHGGVEAGSDEEENTRERIVKEFHDNPNMFVLIANPAACSEGISLHSVCHHAIYLDRNYNAAQFFTVDGQNTSLRAYQRDGNYYRDRSHLQIQSMTLLIDV